MNGWLGRLGGRNRDGGAGILIQTAREVVGRRRSLQGGLNEVRHPAVLDALSEEDFRFLDTTIAERVHSDREFATVLARLTHLAARAKGFERQTVDAALRLEPLLPADDPSREREKLLRDAYGAAQRAGYIRGGRLTLARLGQRFQEAGDSERARALFAQQLDIADESHDTSSEVDTALQLGDLNRRDGDPHGAHELFRRAGRSAQRLDYQRGIAESLVRQIDMLPPGTPVETVAALQKQALDAAQRTLDRVLESRIAAGLADSLSRVGKPEEAVDQLRAGLEIAREIGDLSLESRCLNALVTAERRLGRTSDASAYERELFSLEERLGNRPAAAGAAVKLGASLLSLGKAREALDTFERARTLALAVGDLTVEQRAFGGIGVAQAALGHPTESLENLMRALDLARRSNDYAHEAQWLGSIGQTLWTFGQPDDAAQSASEALAIARRLDDLDMQASMTTLLGRIYASTKQATRARESFGRALQLYRRLEEPGEEVAILSALGGLAVESGQPAQAVAYYEEALQLASSSGEPAQAARLHGKLGRLAQKRNDREAELSHLRRAVELAGATDQPKLLSKALQHYAAALHARHDPGAVDAYGDALALTQELHDEAGEALMRLNLGTLLAGNGHRAEGLQHLHHAAALAARFGDDGTALRRHIDDAIATLEEQTPLLEPAPSRAEHFRPRLPFRRSDDRRHRDRPASNELEEAAPQPEPEDQVFHEATLPPD